MRPASRLAVVASAAVLAMTAAGAQEGVSPKVWFVDNTAQPAGDGSLDHPLSTLTAAESRSGPGDWIFVRTGDGSSAGLDSGIRLKPNQALIGEGVGLDSGPLIPAGAAPVITNPGGPGVVLASGCEVAGLEIAEVGGAGVSSDGARELRIRDLKIVSSSGPGIELREPGGGVVIDRVEVSGSADDGLLLIGSAERPAAGIELGDCRFSDIARNAIRGVFTGHDVASLVIDGCDMRDIGGTAVAIEVADRAGMELQLSRSRLVRAGIGVDLTVLDAASLDYRIIDNPEMSEIEGTVINLFVDPDSTAGARASGEISRNAALSKRPGSGFGIRLSCNGAGHAAAVVRDNRITGGVDYDFGFLAEARLGAGTLALELTGNEITVGPEALAAVAVRSRDDTRVCARIGENRCDGAAVGIRLQQRGNAVLSLVGDAVAQMDVEAATRRLTAANPAAAGVEISAEAGVIGGVDDCGMQKEMTP